ncbi:MAG: type II toxin-antitoxin system PemK/MazF family toxin [Limnohabitans sp.]|nr:type II toxin-antitoxin system PemK/MazF family toxin [Limnohabitans sp.]
MSVGVNIGHEQDGKNESFERPVLVIRKFNSDSFIGVPLSTAIKENNPFYFDFIYKGERISVILSQIRLFSAKRLLRYMYKVPRGGFIKIQDELRKVLKL